MTLNVFRGRKALTQIVYCTCTDICIYMYIRCKIYSFTCCLVSEHNSFGMFIHVFQTDTRKLGGVYLVDVSF